MDPEALVDRIQWQAKYFGFKGKIPKETGNSSNDGMEDIERGIGALKL